MTVPSTPVRIALLSAAGLALVTGLTSPINSASASVADSSEPTAAAAPLRILLTNDDGWDGGGLLALRDALDAAGFDVVVFAPADDQSGNSSRMTFGAPLTITQQDEDVFSVAGSPADSAEAGLSLAFPSSTPDLVISGPNPGNNIANATIHSGTIGAAVTALSEGVPAIAVSTASDLETGETDYTTTTEFVVDLVDALVANAGGGALLPDGLGLNVNVPATPAGSAPDGVAITTTDRSYIDLDYAGVELPVVGESVDATATFALIPTVDPASDSGALDDGLVAITFIEGNYDATDRDDRAAEVAALTPVLTAIL